MARPSRGAPGRAPDTADACDGNASSNSIASSAAPRVIAEFSDYAGLIAALRARAHDRRVAITGADLDETAGLPRYYIAKLLSVHPVKRIGAISMGPVLSVLGVKLQLVEDDEALERYGSKIPQRQERHVRAVHSSAFTQTRSRQFMRKIGKMGAQVRWSRARKVHAAASAAAKVRWSKR